MSKTTKTSKLNYQGVKMLGSLREAEALARSLGAAHVATEVTADDDVSRCFGAMRLRDRAVFGAGGVYVSGTAW